MRKYKVLLAEIDPKLYTRLKVRLARDGCSYRSWLVDQIKQFLSNQKNTTRSKPIGGSDGEEA